MTYPDLKSAASSAQRGSPPIEVTRRIVAGIAFSAGGPLNHGPAGSLGVLPKTARCRRPAGPRPLVAGTFSLQGGAAPAWGATSMPGAASRVGYPR